MILNALSSLILFSAISFYRYFSRRAPEATGKSSVAIYSHVINSAVTSQAV